MHYLIHDLHFAFCNQWRASKIQFRIDLRSTTADTTPQSCLFSQCFILGLLKMCCRTVKLSDAGRQTAPRVHLNTDPVLLPHKQHLLQVTSTCDDVVHLLQRRLQHVTGLRFHGDGRKHQTYSFLVWTQIKKMLNNVTLKTVLKRGILIRI